MGIPQHEYKHNGEEARSKEAVRRQEGWPQVQDGNLQDLHLQGLEASAPGHRYLLQGDVHHELLHQRHLQKDRHRSRQARAIQQSRRSPPAKSKPRSASSCRVSSPSTPSPKVPRRSPSSPPRKLFTGRADQLTTSKNYKKNQNRRCRPQSAVLRHGVHLTPPSSKICPSKTNRLFASTRPPNVQI